MTACAGFQFQSGTTDRGALYGLPNHARSAVSVSAITQSGRNRTGFPNEFMISPSGRDGDKSWALYCATELTNTVFAIEPDKVYEETLKAWHSALKKNISAKEILLSGDNLKAFYRFTLADAIYPSGKRMEEHMADVVRQQLHYPSIPRENVVDGSTESASRSPVGSPFAEVVQRASDGRNELNSCEEKPSVKNEISVHPATHYPTWLKVTGVGSIGFLFGAAGFAVYGAHTWAFVFGVCAALGISFSGETARKFQQTSRGEQ